MGLALWTHATDPETTGARLGLRGRPLIGWTRLVEVDRRLGPAVQAASDDAALEEALGASSAAERRALTALCPSLGGELRHYEEVVRPTPQLLGGSELRESGLPEGAAIGEALRCIRRAQLRHEVGTSAEALALLGLPLPS